MLKKKGKCAYDKFFELGIKTTLSAQISANFSILRTKWHFHIGCIDIVIERLKCQTTI